MGWFRLAWVRALLALAFLCVSVPSGCRRRKTSSSHAVDRLVAAGRQAWREGRLREAERLLARAASQGTLPLGDARLLARIQRRLGKVRAAEETLATGLGSAGPKDPEWYPAVLDLADLAADTGRANRAAELYALAVEAYPRRVRAYWALARLYEANEQWEDAVSVYRKLLDAHPGEAAEAEARVRWARVAVEAGRRKEAERLLGQVLSARSVPARIRYEALLLRAALLGHRKETDAAIRALREAVKVFPKGRKAWVLLGRLLQERQGCPAARSAWLKAGQLGAALPGEALACLYRSGRPPKLLAWARHSVESHPEDLLASVILAELLVDAGRAAQALELLEAVQPDEGASGAETVAYWTARARALGAQDRHAEAFSAYCRAVLLAPEDPRARRGQALEAAWAGRFEEAESLLAEQLRKAPSDPELLVALAAVRIAQHRLRRARRLLAEAGKAPGRFAGLVQVYRGWLALEEGRPEEARRLVAPLAGEPGPYRLHALDVAARALAALGRMGPARNMLTTAIRLSQTAARRAYFERQLEELRPKAVPRRSGRAVGIRPGWRPPPRR